MALNIPAGIAAIPGGLLLELITGALVVRTGPSGKTPSVISTWLFSSLSSGS
jgi:hypothetical protein